MKKSALITGGTIRVGQAIAERLRSQGWRVIVSSHRPDAGADIVADLSEPMGAAKLYAKALALLGGKPPDALINNAALFTGDAEAIENINLLAPKKLTMMMAGREIGMGAVVNILDSKALSPLTENSSPYIRAKHSLYEETLRAAEMFASTLRVNAVAPGPVLAPSNIHVKAGELLLEQRPRVEDVAAAVDFLLTSDAITGVIIPVDAGQHLLYR